MDSLRQDLRFALRSLGRSPAFTIVAVLCMALGIAANVFVYSPFNALLLRPMPYRDADRVMRVNTWRTEESRQNWSSWSWTDYQDVRAASTDHFAATGLYRVGQWNVGNLAEPERVSGARVTSALLPMLGFQPALGRFFTDAEELEGRTAVLGHGLWQRKFGGDSSVVGRAVTINGLPYTVVGVMEEGVRFPETEDLWLPAEPTPDQRTNRDFHAWQFLGRLAAGVSLTQAEQGVQATMATLATRFPETNRTKSAWLLPTNDDLAAEVGPIFYTMVGAVAFVLLIACSNVANLLLARGSARQRELAVRLSMGATRRRLVVQLLTESVMLSVLGGIAGILLGTWGVDAFIRWGLPTEVPYFMHFEVDRTVLLLATAITVVSGVIFGIVPALALTRPDLAVALREAGGRGGSAHASLGRWRSGLVVAQLGLAGPPRRRGPHGAELPALTESQTRLCHHERADRLRGPRRRTVRERQRPGRGPRGTAAGAGFGARYTIGGHGRLVAGRRVLHVGRLPPSRLRGGARRSPDGDVERRLARLLCRGRDPAAAWPRVHGGRSTRRTERRRDLPGPRRARVGRA
ncbi:MAG: ABC transporter permease [Gemmatimonadetes bacterium]|nr:ABC transporter permease [Gemmatimonadota bacterium]